MIRWITHSIHCPNDTSQLLDSFNDYFFKKKVKDGIVAKIGNISELTAVHYFTRVHGTHIHYVKVLLGNDKYAHVTLMLPRFGKPGPPTLADVLLDRKADDPVEQFGLHYD